MHEERYYTELAAAFVQGKLGAMMHLSPDEIIQQGLAAELRLHKFKRNAELPRVRKALGMLRGLAPKTLLDVGSGRGTFLFLLLNEFPGMPITSIEMSDFLLDFKLFIGFQSYNQLVVKILHRRFLSVVHHCFCKFESQVAA